MVEFEVDEDVLRRTVMFASRQRFRYHRPEAALSPL